MLTRISAIIRYAIMALTLPDFMTVHVDNGTSAFSTIAYASPVPWRSACARNLDTEGFNHWYAREVRVLEARLRRASTRYRKMPETSALIKGAENGMLQAYNTLMEFTSPALKPLKEDWKA